MSESRQIASQDRPTVTVLINGSELSQSVDILAVHCTSQFNRISTATIIVSDGDPASEDFEISSGDNFTPGNEVEIKMGYAADEPDVIFKGIVVKQRIKGKSQGSQTEVLCKHEVFRSAYSEKYAVFQDSSDADIIEGILDNYGISKTIESTTITHQNMVQYRSTDWDFLVSRAEANGHVTLSVPGEVKTIKPEVVSAAVLSLQYGATLISFEAELDGRLQEEKLTAYSWDYSSGEQITGEAEQGDLATAGNLDSTDLADSLENNEEQSHYTAIHMQEEVDAVAQGEQTRRRLSRLQGTLTCQGNAQVEPGVTVELAGLGERFNGKALVSGVTQSYQNGTWLTSLQIGTRAESHLETFKPRPKSSYLIPRVQGLEIGVVTDLADPNDENRVQIKLPVFDNEEGVWARMAQPDAGDGRGVFWRPEIGDEVIVGFINDDPRAPVILGMLHSSARPSPINQTDDNHEKGIVTREELKLLFDDDKKEVTIETPNGNTLVISDDDASITLEDEHGNKIQMSADGISYDSPGDIVLKATGDVKIEGMNVSIAANAQFKAEGSAGAEVSASGTTVIKGSVVQIN